MVGKIFLFILSFIGVMISGPVLAVLAILVFKVDFDSLLVQHAMVINILFALYGIFVSADESVNKAYISDLVGEERRGLALGAYNTGMGAVYLPANVLFGMAWAAFGAGVAFGGAAILAFAAAVWMMMFKDKPAASA